MRIVVSERANREDNEVMAYLGEVSPRLPRKYSSALDYLLDRLKQFPLAGRKTDVADVRAIPIKGFPYVVFYQVKGNEIAILSIFHTAKNPSKHPGH